MSAVNIPGSNTAVNVNIRALGTSSSASVTYKTKILKPNLVDDVNTLTQAMLDASGANTKFVIKYDFDLAGEEITIPEDCILEFDGGSLNNGTLIGQITQIDAVNDSIFTSISIDGTWNCPYITSEWFSDIESNNILKQLFNLCSDDIHNDVYIENGTYVVSVSSNKESVITPSSNTDIYLNGTIQLQTNPYTHYYIFNLSNNIINIYGNNTQIIGDRQTHDYTTLYPDATHEFGTAIVISGDNNSVHNVICTQYTGDGIYIGNNIYGNSNINIENVEISHCRRQGISITNSNTININNFYIHDIFRDSDDISGANPGAVIDIEPNGSYIAKNIIIKNGKTNNTRHGIIMGQCENIELSNISLCQTCTYISVAYTKNFVANNIIGSDGIRMSSTGLIAIKTEANCTFNSCTFETTDGALLLGNAVNRGVVFNDCSFNSSVGVGYYRGIMFNRCYFTATSIGAQISTAIITTYNSCVFDVSKFVICDTTFFKNCIFNAEELNNQYYFDKYGDHSFTVDNCIFNLSGTLSRGIFRASSGLIGAVCKNTVFNCQNLSVPALFFFISGTRGYTENNIYNFSDSIKIGGNVQIPFKRKIGTTALRPIDIPFDETFNYYDTDIKKIIQWNGTSWIEEDGAVAGVFRNGTFANKPSSSDIYVGFKYFCTDKQTTEGATDGIEIIHKGDDVWVDALGRVVE